MRKIATINHYDIFIKSILGAWILVTGLRVQLTNTSQVANKKESTVSAPCSAKQKMDSGGRINMPKAQQGFGVLSVALGSHVSAYYLWNGISLG